MLRSVSASLAVVALAATLLTGCATMRDGLAVVDELSALQAPATLDVPLNSHCPEEVHARHVENGLVPVTDFARVTDPVLADLVTKADFDCVYTILEGDVAAPIGFIAVEIDPEETRTVELEMAFAGIGFEFDGDHTWARADGSWSVLVIPSADYDTEPLTFVIDDLGHTYTVYNVTAPQ